MRHAASSAQPKYDNAGYMTNTGSGTATAISSGNEAADYGVAADHKAQTPDQFQKRVKEKFPDLVLTADQQGQWRGMEALEVLRLQGLDIPMIVGESMRRAAPVSPARVELSVAGTNTALYDWPMIETL